MTPLKLMSHSGEVLGAVIVPEAAWVLLKSGKDAVFHYSGPVSFQPLAVQESIEVKTVVLAPFSSGDGSVMLTLGDLWTFEKIPGCFFFPGYGFMRRAGR